MPVKLPYVMEMPPKGGYPQIPYKRHIPVRGGSMGGLVVGGVFIWMMARMHNGVMEMENMNNFHDDLQAKAVWKPLIDAERRRHEVRRRKEYFEQLNLNLVATKIYPNLDPLRDAEGLHAPFNEWEGGESVQLDWSGPDNRGMFGSISQRRPDGINPVKRAVTEYMIQKGAYPVGP